MSKNARKWTVWHPSMRQPSWARTCQGKEVSTDTVSAEAKDSGVARACGVSERTRSRSDVAEALALVAGALNG